MREAIRRLQLRDKLVIGYLIVSIAVLSPFVSGIVDRTLWFSAVHKLDLVLVGIIVEAEGDASAARLDVRLVNPTDYGVLRASSVVFTLFVVSVEGNSHELGGTNINPDRMLTSKAPVDISASIPVDAADFEKFKHLFFNETGSQSNDQLLLSSVVHVTSPLSESLQVIVSFCNKYPGGEPSHCPRPEPPPRTRFG